MINILFYQILAFTIHGKIKKTLKTNKLEIPPSTWNVELPDGSYSVSDIQDYFKYIFKIMRELLIILQ